MTNVEAACEPAAPGSERTRQGDYPVQRITTVVLMGLLVGCAVHAGTARAQWKPAKNPLMTRWAKDVSPEKVHPEYPRPQMRRSTWQNLNGLWEFALLEKEAPQPKKYPDKILVPYPVESALSGLRKAVEPKHRMWYRREFTVPRSWKGGRVLLHFGGVDWDTTVYVDGKQAGAHRGGYDPIPTPPARACDRCPDNR